MEKQGSATLQDLVDVLKNEEDMDYIVSLEEIASITGVETIGDVNEIYVVYKIYQFRVDDRLQTEFISIVESYTADVAISSTLKSHDGKNEDEKYLATFEIKVESEGQVQSIEIETVDGKITEVPTSLPYTKEIQVEIGQKYIVKVTTPDGKYKRYVIEEKAEETIRTAQELATFRDKVNSGLTYEGKTVTLVNDINLSSVCGENVNGQEISWEPIAKYEEDKTEYFKGTFDGNNKTINNLYMNNTSENGGLFYQNEGTIDGLKINNGEINASDIGMIAVVNIGTISNVTIEENNILNAQSGAGGISLHNYGNIFNSINKANIKAGIAGTSTYSVGGIASWAKEGCQINNCINTGNIDNNGTTSGGIVGRIQSESATVKDCYNIGKITSKRESGGIVGFVNLASGVVTVNIQNCYNIGTLVSNTNKGGVVGNYTNTSGSTFNISNNYWISGCGATYGIAKANKNTGCTKFTSSLDYTLLGDSFIADGKIKDKNGQWVDNVDSQGNIIYINGGYPILKWQIGE